MEMKEAIEILEELQKFLKKLRTIEETKTIQKALDEALKALAYTEFMKGQHSCNDCAGAKECGIKPGWGHVVRINCVEWRGELETQERQYTFGNDEFNLEAAYHDCKMVFDGITDDDSFQEADTWLILYYANEIIYALHEALEGKDGEG